MKKLMTTMLAVAAGVSLHAVGMADTGTSFEGLTGDAPYDIYASTGELSAQEAGQTYWVTNGTETLNVVAGTSVTAEYDHPGVPSRPDQYIDNASSQDKYLSIKTTLGNPVTRNVSVGGAGTSIGTGFYFDSLVKFTAFEGEQTVDLNGGKLAIWLQENLDDGTQEPVSTNLVVTAGYLDGLGGVVTTNYPCNVAGVDFGDGGWHRVTVKAIGSIYNGDTVPGFVVYVDGVYATSSAAKGIDTSALTDNAYAFNARGALFPSADQSSGAISTISAVAFDGQGDVDDLVFTATAPDFAKDNEFFTIELGANVESLTYSMRGMGLSVTITETTRIQYTAGMGVTVTDVTYANGYMSDGISMSASVTLTDGSYYPGAAEQSITANAKRLGATVMIHGMSTPYETLADAMDAINALPSASDVTLTLNDSATSGITLNNANATVTLDLAGNTITNGSDAAAAVYAQTGTLIITNTTETVGKVVAAVAEGQLQKAVHKRNAASVTIQAGIYDGSVSATSVTGGAFSVNENKDPESLTVPPAPNAALAAAVMTGYALEVVSGSSYYTLVEVVTPSTWTVTFLNDGDTYDTVEVEDGQVCVLPDAPTKEHYTFAGWYPYNIGALQPYDFTQPITADVTVEAHYTADTYTVSFDTAGGDVMPAIPDQSVTYNEYADDPNVTPVKEHYLFKWWSADASSEFVFASTPIVANTQLTAVYTAAVYTVTFMVDGSLYDTKTAEYNTTLAVLPENPTKAECVFTGWSTNSTAEGVVDLQSFLITGTTELNAIWTVLPPPEITPETGNVSVTIEAESAEAAIAAVIVEPPAGSGADAAEYKALFDFEAVAAGNGEYTVTLTSIKDSVVTGVDTSAVSLLTSSASEGTITVPAGLYYRITPSTALPISGTPVSGLSTGASETVTKPGTTQGFYKVELSAVPFAVPNP